MSVKVRGRTRSAARFGVPAWPLVAMLIFAMPARAQQWAIVDPEQGPVPLSSGSTGAAELSGLTWAGGRRYYAVSDSAPVLYPLTIDVDPQNGTIRSAVLEPGTRLPGSEDLEGLVDAGDGTVIVSDEVGPAIRRYRIADGGLADIVTLPSVFASVRKNQSLEGLSMDPQRRTLWTTDEEALLPDGPVSTFNTGTVVRLQRFDWTPASEGAPTPAPPRAAPSGQWAYLTEPVPGDIFSPGRDVEASGVSELIALPGGGLLVLERAYGAVGTRSRLYEVDFSGATDTTALPTLAGAAFTPARKRLLWERTFQNVNYEGAALGAALESGGRSLILISDDGHHLRQALYALVLKPAGG